MFNVVLGAVTVSIGLTFWWALIAIAAGTLIGALLIALHATQGPRLGVPQSIQSRGQFGFYGSAFMFPAVLVLNVGFIAARAGHPGPGHARRHRRADHPAVDRGPGRPLGGDRDLRLPVDPLGHAGHRHRRRRLAGHHAHPGPAVRRAARPARRRLARPTAGLFLAGVALLVIDMLSFGPFVSDYTRYLPAPTSGRRLFWAIYAGNVLATFFSCAVGAYLAALLPSLGPVAAIGKVSGIVGAGHHGRAAWSTRTRSTPTPARSRSWRSAACGAGSRPNRWPCGWSRSCA